MLCCFPPIQQLVSRRGVDYSDQMASYHSSIRKPLKWYKKLVLELITGTVMVNAWILYNLTTVGQPGREKNIDLLSFQESVACGLVGMDPKIQSTPGTSNTKRRLHTLMEKEGQARTVRRRCTSCYQDNRDKGLSARESDKITKQVVTYCVQCPSTPHMCLPCFNKRHTS